MPLQQAAPRLPASRFHLPSKPRQRMLESIEQLFGMSAVIGPCTPRRKYDVHIAAAGCAECILVPSFQLAGRHSAYLLSKAQTWGRRFWRHVGGRAVRPAHGTTHSL